MVVVTLELGGGLDLLFGRQKRFAGVDIPPAQPGAPVDMRAALAWVRTTLLRERPELFMDGDSVRPGILVLINDADWELEGGLEYALRDGDVVCLISTLHGG